MTLELKQYKDKFFNNSTESYVLGGVKKITDKTVYGEGHFSITIFDERFFITSCFEYVKDRDSGKMFVENGKWVAENTDKCPTSNFKAKTVKFIRLTIKIAYRSIMTKLGGI